MEERAPTPRLLVWLVATSLGQPVTFLLDRGGKTLTVDVTPVARDRTTG